MNPAVVATPHDYRRAVDHVFVCRIDCEGCQIAAAYARQRPRVDVRRRRTHGTSRHIHRCPVFAGIGGLENSYDPGGGSAIGTLTSFG